MILGVVFRAKLSDEDIAEIECLRVVAMATNFGTKVSMIATRQLVMEGGLSGHWSANKMQILPILCH